mmetsp:Transcript_32375/g.65899  ORF Transcript_32375/g.65899 Transcript_32375/m.65899 type:complete len:105 (-) Transcript_32375:27-341(-)
MEKRSSVPLPSFDLFLAAIARLFVGDKSLAELVKALLPGAAGGRFFTKKRSMPPPDFFASAAPLFFGDGAMADYVIMFIDFTNTTTNKRVCRCQSDHQATQRGN